MEILDALTWMVVGVSAVGWVFIVKNRGLKKRDDHKG